MPRGRSKDSQRGRVYEAENALHWLYNGVEQTGNPVVTVNGVTVTLPPEAKFANVDSIQTYVNRVMALPGVVHQFGHRPPPRVRERRGSTKAHYCAGVIAIPMDRLGKWAQRELVVLHELAHHLAPGDGHGPRFVSASLVLFGAALGPEVELIGRMIYADNEVKTSSGVKNKKEIAS